MNQINVRIRHEDDSEALPFGTWDLARIDELIPLLQKWGVAYDYTTEDWELSGQFVIADGAAFFEVLIGTPDADA